MKYIVMEGIVRKLPYVNSDLKPTHITVTEKLSVYNQFICIFVYICK